MKIKTKKYILLVLFMIGFSGYSQTVLISGKVVDEQGVPLPGVTILEKATVNGTSTDFDGKYVIDIALNKTLVFSYVGFNSQEITVSDESTINVILKENLEALDEVQVVAFSKQKKSSVIGSVTTVKASELKQPSTNLTNSFAGRIAGMISYQRSGEPGQDNAEFFIRGVTTFGYKNNPLILIDGLQVEPSDLARIEPDNIASFSIMKDATATSLYGARGANGVILVTTKEGKKGKARVSFRYENSFSAPSQTNEFVEAVEYMELFNKAQRSRDQSAILLYSKDKIEGTRAGIDNNIFPNVDWSDQLFKPYTLNRNANLNVNGGGEVAQYYLSVSHNNETGLLKVDPLNNFNNNIDINRSNLRANINIDITKTSEIAVKFNSLFQRYNGPTVSANDIFGMVMQSNPANFPAVYDPDENTQFYKHTLFGNKGNASFPNPYAEMVRGYKDRFSHTTLSQVELRQKLDFITEGLKFRGMASVRTYTENENNRSFVPFYYGMGEVNTDQGVDYSLYQIQEGTEYLGDPVVSTYGNSNFYYELVTEYNRLFNEKHQVGGLVVFNFSEALNTIGGQGTFATLPSRNMGLSGRFSYSFDDRYFGEFNFGYNGSEKFSEENRFGFFPSIGFGWITSNEKWFEEALPSVNLFKLRYTYGLVGNDAISAPSDRFFYLSDVNLNNGGTGYTWGINANNYYNGYFVNRYGNPEVTWEVAKKTNYGIELGLFNSIMIQADYFIEDREQIYMQRQYIPESMGLTTSISSNIGKVKSSGFDVSLDYNQSFNNGWYLSARGNFTYAKNEIKVNGEPEYQNENLSRIGHPINQQWGYVAERLFIDDEDIENSPDQFNGKLSNAYLPGDIKYKDINGDNAINELDQVPIGKPYVPEIVYGFGFSAGYKNIDLSMFMQGVARTSFSIQPENISPFVGERNALKIITDNYWSEDNPDPYAFWPRLSTYGINNNEQPSTWWLRDGDFLRLKSVELGYTIPGRIGSFFDNVNARIYFTGLNLLNFSKFDLWDPEMAGNGLGYPPQRVYNLGIQLKF
jgi:TonB-linked SusC/RagA family outer membrane protein